MTFQKMIHDPKTGKPVLVDETPEDVADREARQAFDLSLRQKEDARAAAIAALPAREEIEKMKAADLKDVVLKLYDVVVHLVGKA